MPKPLCFMVMPYGRKATKAEPGKGPAEIDFNALWDRAYVPVIEALGYEPVRADQDTGALIITQMLERLYFADLVLADMTIANGNVYYEIGIRHAAQPTGCVLLAADWSVQLFDVAQMRTIRYPLPDGDVSESTAAAVRDAITGEIRRLRRGTSPMFDSIKGYPSDVDDSAATTMKDQMAAQAAFQAQVRAVRAAPHAERMARARELLELHGRPPMTPPIALALLRLLRDCAETVEDCNVPLGFIETLPDEVRSVAEVREQHALALSNNGRHLEAIAELEALLTTDRPTPERLGILGGRYKRLMGPPDAPTDRQALTRAIESYERGMALDLNEYYCASNLPALYRTRKRAGDEGRAQSVLHVVIAAADCARRRGATDPWLRRTLLCAAFDAGEADMALEIAEEVADEYGARWEIDSILGQLRMSLRHIADDTLRKRLVTVVATLERSRE